MTKTTILALDLATKTGFAIGDPRVGVDRSGVLQLAKARDKAGMPFARLDAWLENQIATYRVTQVVYETPINPRLMKGPTNFSTTRRLHGLCGIAEARAASAGIEPTEIAAQKVRKHLLGQRPAKGQAKAEVMRAVRALRHNPEDDNEADALAIWYYAAAIFAPGVVRSTPLDLRG